MGVDLRCFWVEAGHEFPSGKDVKDDLKGEAQERLLLDWLKVLLVLNDDELVCPDCFFQVLQVRVWLTSARFPVLVMVVFYARNV
jgi:hypothetical protein